MIWQQFSVDNPALPKEKRLKQYIKNCRISFMVLLDFPALVIFVQLRHGYFTHVGSLLRIVTFEKSYLSLKKIAYGI